MATRYRFDGFELDTEVVELRKGDERIPLEPQVFDVLAYLVANRHRLVPKDELLEHIWPEKYISEADSSVPSTLKPKAACRKSQPGPNRPRPSAFAPRSTARASRMPPRGVALR